MLPVRNFWEEGEHWVKLVETKSGHPWMEIHPRVWLSCQRGRCDEVLALLTGKAGVEMQQHRNEPDPVPWIRTQSPHLALSQELRVRCFSCFTPSCTSCSPLPWHFSPVSSARFIAAEFQWPQGSPSGWYTLVMGRAGVQGWGISHLTRCPQCRSDITGDQGRGWLDKKDDEDGMGN